jgi:hypothetical protein
MEMLCNFWEFHFASIQKSYSGICSRRLQPALKKWFLECESLSERRGYPALRGFRGFKLVRELEFPNHSLVGHQDSARSGKIQFPHEQEGFSTHPSACEGSSPQGVPPNLFGNRTA